jgi:DNA-binding XRE family transcriptional regulator
MARADELKAAVMVVLDDFLPDDPQDLDWASLKQISAVFASCQERLFDIAVEKARRDERRLEQISGAMRQIMGAISPAQESSSGTTPTLTGPAGVQQAAPAGERSEAQPREPEAREGAAIRPSPFPPAPPSSEVPERLLALRAGLGLSMLQLADSLGVAKSTVSRWERGLGKPSPLLWQKLLELEKTNPVPDAVTPFSSDRASRLYVADGPFAGMHRTRKAACRFCGVGVRVYDAIRQGWEASDVCFECQQALLQRVRGGPSSSNPWEGVPNDAVVWCEGCNHRSRAELVRKEWPLPDLCDRCAQEAEPDREKDLRTVALSENPGPLSPEDARWLKSQSDAGKALVGDPVVTFSPEGPEIIGRIVHAEKEPPPNAVPADLNVSSGEHWSRYRAERIALNKSVRKREFNHRGTRSKAS